MSALTSNDSGGRNNILILVIHVLLKGLKSYDTLYYPCIRYFSGNEQQTMESGPSAATSSEPVVEQGVLIYV